MGMIGNSLAQGLISGANIQDGTVDTPDIKDGAVHTAKVADDAVHTAKIADDAVHTAKIADGAVTSDKLADSMSVSVGHGSTSWTGITGSALGYSNQGYKITQVGASTGTNNIALGVDVSGNTSGAFTGYRDIFVSNDAGLYQPNSTNDDYHQLMGWDDNETVFNDSGSARDFRVESDSNQHMLFVDGGSGYVSIGSTAPGSSWRSTDGVRFIGYGHNNYGYSEFVRTSDNDPSANIYVARNNDGRMFSFNRQSGEVGSVTITTSGTSYNTTSDRRLKDNIEPIADGTEKLMAMKPVTHTWIADPEADAVHGFIAQEMQEIIPEAVSGDPDGEEMMAMDYGRITPVLVAALQDAHKKIAELETRLNTLEGQ